MSLMSGALISTLKELPGVCVVTESGRDVLLLGVTKILDLLVTAVVWTIIFVLPAGSIASPTDAESTSVAIISPGWSVSSRVA